MLDPNKEVSYFVFEVESTVLVPIYEDDEIDTNEISNDIEIVENT